MGIGAIVLGVFAFICTIGGALLAWVPFLGTMLSFLAPVLALGGIILGGVALSRAKAGAGESEGLAIGGLVTSIVAFIPSVVVALTCGLCNTCATAMYLDPSITAYDAGRHEAGVLSNGSASPPGMPLVPLAPPTSLAPASTVPGPTVPAPTVLAPPVPAPTVLAPPSAAPPSTFAPLPSTAGMPAPTTPPTSGAQAH